MRQLLTWVGPATALLAATLAPWYVRAAVIAVALTVAATDVVRVILDYRLRRMAVERVPPAMVAAVVGGDASAHSSTCAALVSCRSRTLNSHRMRGLGSPQLFGPEGTPRCPPKR